MQKGVMPSGQLVGQWEPFYEYYEDRSGWTSIVLMANTMAPIIAANKTIELNMKRGACEVYNKSLNKVTSFKPYRI
jgi:hypothetical protein